MPWYRKAQFIVMTVALIAVSRLGWEFYVNDLESISVIEICGYTALSALYINLFLAIYRLVKERKNKQYKEKLPTGLNYTKIDKR